MANVDDLGIRRDLKNHSLQRANKMISNPEVSSESDNRPAGQVPSRVQKDRKV